MKNHFIYIFVLFISCTNQIERNISNTLQNAKDNSMALEAVFHYYEKENPNELKLEAARFLIANMNGHYSTQSKTLERFQHKIHHYSDTIVLNMPVINRLWKEASNECKKEVSSLYDAET